MRAFEQNVNNVRHFRQAEPENNSNKKLTIVKFVIEKNQLKVC